MDEQCAALREKHLSGLQRAESREMYDRTLAQCAARPDGVQPCDLDMIYDLCSYEDVKRALMEDIRQRGVMLEGRNGRQTYCKENPALSRVSRYAELQRKIRADLKLTPGRRARDEDADENDGSEDDFAAF